MYVCALTDLLEMFFSRLPIRRSLASSPHLLLHVIRLYIFGLCTTTFLNFNPSFGCVCFFPFILVFRDASRFFYLFPKTKFIC